MKKLKDVFLEQFGQDGDLTHFYAPGRVNLIGEHTDYNGGHVFPCALSVGTYAVARKRKDQKVKFYSTNFSELGIIETNLKELKYEEKHNWANYPKGVIAGIQENFVDLPYGLEIAFYGNIPNGAGLSSSASIELVTGIVVNELFDLNIDRIELVKLSQKAENEFVGVNCGIMDQFAIGMGKKDHAILLDCDSLNYTYTLIKLEKEKLIIANTNKRRGLADSKYNERRQQCEQALRELQHELNIVSLGDLSIDEFEQNKHLISDDIVTKRARHAVYENQRTIQAVEKLKQGNVEEFGKLMNESHKSLRDDYEVTGKELDALAEAAWSEGAIGARMTGAGFGGCTINLVHEESVESFIADVGRKYTEETGLTADFYVVDIGDGAKVLSEVDV
ncbi:galactokinase [Halobacillus sp. Marseille-Q1614]|uniref:galactokinase n=1 Tax=Halobacillus sp. Marseille-Q1614 TaxID=2709134 RepID=UPI0015705289|nr:galactokinase [Halobacillus sp. Marseille-Q1614]